MSSRVEQDNYGPVFLTTVSNLIVGSHQRQLRFHYGSHDLFI